MKTRFVITLLLAVFVCACSTTDFRSRKQVTQGIDYSRYPGNEVYYEFTSDIPLDPSVLAGGQEEAQPGQPLSEEEDFTSENIASTYGNYGDVVVNVAAHKFKLGPSASRTEMTVFQKALDQAYTAALRKYRPVGFTYAMSSVGAVNPLSDIEVRCMLSERSANDVGQSTCTLFFNTLASTYIELMKEAQ